MDNLYYVGPGTVSVWLIPTSAGLILIDTAQEPYVDTVIDNIRKVGFDPKNIKLHPASATATSITSAVPPRSRSSRARAWRSRRPTGISWRRRKPTRSRTAAPPKPGDEAPKKDMVIKEGDTVKLGDTSLKVYIMPGHTPGSVTYTFTAYDNKKPYKALVFGGPGPRNGVDGGTEFLASVERLEKNFADTQVAVNVHSYLNSYPYPHDMGILELRDLKAKNPTGPNPFINNALWREWLKDAHAGAVKLHRRGEGEGPEGDDELGKSQTPTPNSQAQRSEGPASWKLGVGDWELSL